MPEKFSTLWEWHALWEWTSTTSKFLSRTSADTAWDWRLILFLFSNWRSRDRSQQRCNVVVVGRSSRHWSATLFRCSESVLEIVSVVSASLLLTLPCQPILLLMWQLVMMRLHDDAFLSSSTGFHCYLSFTNATFLLWCFYSVALDMQEGFWFRVGLQC